MKEITFIGGAMQKIKSVFFGEHGITSTSANHLSNLAKELIVAYESKINNLNFVTTRIDIVGSQSIEGKIIQQGLTEKNRYYSRSFKRIKQFILKIKGYFLQWNFC